MYNVLSIVTYLIFISFSLMYDALSIVNLLNIHISLMYNVLSIV